ncbi:MAG: ImmA/IrrE family metallo-endopeptidase, partial [Candidatus Competibacteraceae bacterium]|nr:ImmA/IrrE family metallo-endopeptidase [Candidatus Competibacteraceae bacterium]
DSRKLGLQLQHARKQRGMNQEAAASIIGVVRTTIVAIEKGERKVKPDELIKLARAYGRSVSDFVSQRPEIQPFEVQFRGFLGRNDKEEEQIKLLIDKWQEFCRNYLELEEIVGTGLARNYPVKYQTGNLPIERTAESIAISERNRLGLGDGPIHSLRDILEQEVGLRIFYLEMPRRFSEMYAYDERLGGCLAINANHPKERQRWSLAHGYLHFLAHRYKAIYHFDKQYQRVPPSERLAEAFPKYFLMPTSNLLKHFVAYREKGKFTPADLCTIAHYYGVSVEAMVLRLEELELLPTGTWDKLRDRGFKIREARSELGLQEVDERTDQFPLQYQHLAIEAFDLGLITEGRFAGLLGVDRLEARRIAEVLREHSSGLTEGAIDIDLAQA